MTANNKHKNITASTFLMTNESIISMRFSGDDSIDNVFNNKSVIACNTERTYDAMKKMFSDAKILFERNKNFRIYNLYYNAVDEWSLPGRFKENMPKYPDQLIGMHIKKPLGIQNSRGWFMKYQQYYCLLYITHGNPSKNSNINPLDKDYINSEQFIFWKKFTEDELIKYDNGSYWRIVKDYGIRID